MRALKNSLFFLLGVLLVGVPMLAFAGTYPATAGYGAASCSTVYSSADATCTAAMPNLENGVSYIGPIQRSGTSNVWDCTLQYPSGSKQAYRMVQICYSCSNGGSLSGTTCTKTCPDGQPLNADGTCGSQCPQRDYGVSWYQHARGADLSGDYCDSGCTVKLASPLDITDRYESSTHEWSPLSRWQTGQTCTSSTPSPSSSPTPPVQPKKDPPCAPGEGVIGLKNGAVFCVPSTTPGADNPPRTSREESTKKFPDGSTSTTTTINTCTGAGSCTSTTTTTVTPAAGGGTGQAGPVGTSTGKTDKPNGTAGNETEPTNFCKANPSLQMCKGGMNEEATQKQVLDTTKKTLEELEKITKPTITDDSSLTEKGQFKQTEELKQADKDATDRATGSIDPVSVPKSAWESAMSSGFWGPIPQSGCSPHSSKIGPFQWTFDPCPIASKISDIGAYAMWVILAISTFVMVTGGRKA